MAGFTKLFSSIVHSTIWRENDQTRIVWITMLALADKNGIVEASIPGLADVSRVSIYQCKKALTILCSPDEDSRNPDYDGRRIEEIDGGWIVLNYEKYRDFSPDDRYRKQAAERQHRYRNRKRCVTSRNITQHNATSRDVTPRCVPPESESESNTDPDKDKEPPIPPPMGGREKPKQSKKREKTPDPDFETFWQTYPSRRRKGKLAAEKAWNKAKKNGLPPLKALIAILERQKVSWDWTKDGGQYVPLLTTWLNQGRWMDEVEDDNDDDEPYYEPLN